MDVSLKDPSKYQDNFDGADVTSIQYIPQHPVHGSCITMDLHSSLNSFSFPPFLISCGHMAEKILAKSEDISLSKNLNKEMFFQLKILALNCAVFD